MIPELTFGLQLHSAEIQRTHADICAVYGSNQTLYRWFKTLSASVESVKCTIINLAVHSENVD